MFKTVVKGVFLIFFSAFLIPGSFCQTLLSRYWSFFDVEAAVKGQNVIAAGYTNVIYSDSLYLEDTCIEFDSSGRIVCKTICGSDQITFLYYSYISDTIVSVANSYSLENYFTPFRVDTTLVFPKKAVHKSISENISLSRYKSKSRTVNVSVDSIEEVVVASDGNGVPDTVWKSTLFERGNKFVTFRANKPRDELKILREYSDSCRREYKILETQFARTVFQRDVEMDNAPKCLIESESVKESKHFVSYKRLGLCNQKSNFTFLYSDHFAAVFRPHGVDLLVFNRNKLPYKLFSLYFGHCFVINKYQYY